MKPIVQDCPSGPNPSQPPLNRGGAYFALPLLRGSWRGFGSNELPEFKCEYPSTLGTLNRRSLTCRAIALIKNRAEICAPTCFATLLFTFIPPAHADKLGRLFFTPEQRTHLDYNYSRNAPAEGDSSPFITVNGIVQKNGGPRTVWVNGVAQSAEGSRERTPTAQTVSIPGSHPVKIKVGQKILLDQPAESRQNTSGE
jgi:hypothetical protein